MKGKVMMFCQKEEIDHVLGNHKGQGRMLSLVVFRVKQRTF